LLSPSELWAVYRWPPRGSRRWRRIHPRARRALRHLAGVVL